jgi:hypothetical protein
VNDTLPVFGPNQELRTGPAQPARLAAPTVTTTADTTAGPLRTVTLQLTPQRPVRLIALHVNAEAKVTAATIAGRKVPPDQPANGPWGFGFVFHAPAPGGVEVTLTVPAGTPLRLRAMDASDGLTAVPGFSARPADVGVLGSHSSEMLAVARTYPL